MKSMMQKTTLREIRQSLGRYLAIFAIVALGVGFFAGLKITKTAMVESANDYLQEHQLYDYRLLSTLGFEEADVQALEQKENVRAVEGAVEADILYVNEEGNAGVLKAHSLLEHINGLEILAGRMPETAAECVVDANRYNEASLGSKITLSENNEQEDLDYFAFREYTIVGIAQASAYIQFERGNTSLGNGRVDGFMYLPPEGFQSEYYTEIYVKFDRDERIYSAEYDAYMEEREALWEKYCEEQGERRYQAILSEAEAELADARETFETEKADAEKELADAEKELLDAEAEIADGEAQLADGELQLADSKARIEQEEKKLADARTAIEQQKVQLSIMEQALASQDYTGLTATDQISSEQNYATFTLEETGYAALGHIGQSTGPEADGSAYAQQIMAAKLQLMQAEEQIADGEAALEDARRQITEAEQKLEENRQTLEDGRKELAQGWEDYRQARSEFEEQIAEAEQDITEAEADIAAIKRPDTYVLGRDTNVGYVLFENDSSIVEGIANVFPIFFFLVAALVCMTTMNRMVEEQRTQIGVLKALGYGNGRIMGKYLFYSGSAALGGCVVGYFLGIILLDWVMALLCLVASLLCSMGTTWLSCRHELKTSAAGLMRPKAPKAGKRILLERVDFIWNRLKFLHKVSVRNIVRYKKRLCMMVMGISGCTALLVTGFGVRDTVTSIASQQFEEIQIYQLNIALSDPSEELLSLLNSLGGKYIYAFETSLDLETTEGIKAVNLIVAENPAQFGNYIDLHTTSGDNIAYPGPGEIVICNKLAEQYRVKIGDTVHLYDENRRELSAVVSGICENYIYNYVYMDQETYEAAIEEITFKNIYVNLPEDRDIHEAGAHVMNVENVASVQVNADMLVRFSSMMSSMNYIVFVVIGCAAALAFIVLYNLNNINITERIREIATIKVLGFYRSETSSYVFRENMVLTAMGCGLGLLLGKLLHIYVMSQVIIDMISFDVHIKTVSYLLSILLTFVFTWVVNRIMTGKLDRINMAESLKSVD